MIFSHSLSQIGACLYIINKARKRYGEIEVCLFGYIILRTRNIPYLLFSRTCPVSHRHSSIVCPLYVTNGKKTENEEEEKKNKTNKINKTYKIQTN